MTGASSTSRRCLFCNAPADSREHLLADWISGVLPSDEPVVQYLQIGNDESERREWTCKPFRERTRVVCQACNNGWMSSLEVETKQLLAGAIARDGYRYRFAGSAKRVVSAWALKTFLVMQTQGEPIAPPFHGIYLREHGQPPPQVTIWVGSHYGATFDSRASAFVQKPVGLVARDGRFEKVPEFGYAAWLAIGGISFFLVGHRLGNSVEIRTHNFFNTLFTKIWGDGAPPVVDWPPKCMMDQQLVEPLFLEVEPPTLDIRLSPVAA